MKADDFLDFDRDTYLAETDKLAGLPAGWSAAQIAVESNNDLTAVSPAGAMGLAQVMPKTLRSLEKRFGRALDPFNEVDALAIHREVMRENMAHFKNPEDASRAYNNGWDRERWGTKETVDYVPAIQKRMRGGASTKAASAAPSADAFLDEPDEAVIPAALSSGVPAEDADASARGAMGFVKRLGGRLAGSAGDLVAAIGNFGEPESAEDIARDHQSRKLAIHDEIAKVVRGAEAGKITQEDRKVRLAREVEKLKSLDLKTGEKIAVARRRAEAAGPGVMSADAFLDAPDEPAGVGAMDVVKQLGGSIVKSTGDFLTGIGKSGELQAEQGAAESPADKFAIAPLKPDANVAKATGRAGGWLSRVGQGVIDTRSDAAKSAVENTTPEGDIIDAARNLDASKLSMGKAPTAAGVALQAANIAGQVIPQVGLALATRGRSVPEQVAAGTGVGTAQGVGSAVSEVRDYLGSMTDADLAAKSPVFRKMIEVDGLAPADARAALTKQAEDKAVKYVAPVSAAGGAATGALLGKAGGHFLESAAKGGVARAAVGAVLGFTEEGLQEVGEGVAQIAGVNEATGDTRAFGEGSNANFVLGGMGGAGMGAGKGAATRGRPADAKPVNANEVLDKEETPAVLALPAPVVRVDSDGNARMDGSPPPVVDEKAARVSGRAEEVRAAVREELKALGFESTKRATPTPITVDEQGNAVTDDQRETRPVGIEPAARKVGRAEVVRDELTALGYEPSAQRAQQTPITVDGEGNARTDEQSQQREPGRDETLGDLPRTSGRAPVDLAETPEPQGLGYDATQRASATPISVDSEGTARTQGDQRTPTEATRQRLEGEAAKLYPKDAQKRTDWIDAQLQHEMGYESRVRDLAAKVNEKRAKRVKAQEATQPSADRSARDWRPTGELGVVFKANPDNTISYFFASNPEGPLVVGPPSKDGARPITSITGNAQAHGALVRAALADGPIAAGPKTLSRDALKSVPGATVDRYGVTRLVGRDADRARMAAELNHMAAKTATKRADKRLRGDDLELAMAAIAIDPRAASKILGNPDVEAVRTGLREIAPNFLMDRQPADMLAKSDDLAASITEVARSAMEQGDLAESDFRAAERAARNGDHEAAISYLRTADERRGDVSSRIIPETLSIEEDHHDDGRDQESEEPAIRRAPRAAGRSAVAADDGARPLGRGNRSSASEDAGKPEGAVSGSDGRAVERGFGQPSVGLDAALIASTLEASSGWRFHALEQSGLAARTFRAAILAAKNASATGAAVAVYEETDYASMQLFLSADALTGFAVKPDGDIVSVFNHPTVKKRGAGAAMVGLAAKHGGTKLDAFDTVLPEIYSQAGFRAVARIAFNDEYAPEGWDYERFSLFNGGRPDVVFMVFDPDALAKGDLYDPNSIDIQEVESYEEAQRIQNRAVSGRDDLATATLAAARLPGDAESLRRFGGDTVFKNRDGSLRTLFHGTPYEIKSFALGHTPDEKAGAAIFATISPEYASEHYSESHRQFTAGGEPRKNANLAGVPKSLRDRFVGAHVYPVYVRAENPFNWRVKAHREALLNALGLRGTKRDLYNLKLKEGQFKALETKEAMDAMKASGFDSFYVTDHPERIETMGIGVFDPSQIRFALSPAEQENADAPAVSRAARNTNDSVEVDRSNAEAQGSDQDAIDAFGRDLSRDAGRPIGVSLVDIGERDALHQLAREVQAKLGVKVVFFESADDFAPGGAVTPSVADTLFVHADERAPRFIVGHEFLHELRRGHPDLYQALYAALSDHAVTLDAQKAKIRQSYGRDIGFDRTAEENVADVAGVAFADPRFWERFEEALNGDVGKLKRFFRWAARWLSKTFGEKVDLDAEGSLQQAAHRMLDEVAQAYAEAARRNPAVRSMAADMELSVKRSRAARRPTGNSLTAWARSAIKGQGPYAALILEQPVDALRIAGVSWKKPVMLEAQTLKRHILQKHPEITAEMIGQLPELLERPRMVAINRGESGFQVLVDSRDGDGNPILVALKPHDLQSGGQSYAITGIATMFGKDESMKFVADALREGRVKYMPEKELKRLEAYRVGNDALPTDPNKTSEKGIRQPAGRSTATSVLSDEALAKFRANAQGPWRDAAVAVEVPDVPVGSNVKFTPRTRIADELAAVESIRRGAAARGDRGSMTADMESGIRRSSRTSHGFKSEAASPARSTAAHVGAGAIKATAPVTATVQAANKVVDTIGEQLARVTGVKALGNKAVSLTERAINAQTSWTWLEKVKQGVVSDYGLPEEYLDAKLGKQVAENKLMREAKHTLDRLSAMTPDQLAVAYQWLQEKPDTARERELLAKLPAAQQAVMQQMKADVDALSNRAVGLGLITMETYERNKMAYIHRSYKKYEAELSGSQAVARQRAQRLKGDQFKGRGMELEASLDRVRGDLPANLKGMRLEMLEKRDANGKLIRREYLVEGTKRPASLDGYTSAGTWEVRDATKGGNLKVWRDFTLAERQRMGEIEDARYAFARTMVQGIRDVETARFLQWTAINYGKDKADGLDVAEVSGFHMALGSQTFTRDQWVKVPETKIKDTSVARYGDLAGKYIPAVMFSDLMGVMELRNHLWDTLLGAWKTSKTALSPAVHVNNVMANFIMADLADVGVNDIRRALETILRAKAGDASAQALIDRYDDSGAESGSFAANEIKTSVIEPLLKQIAQDEPESVQKASLVNAISLAVHGQFREAGVALTKTLPGRATGATVGAMVKAYQSEDAVFRLAKFLNEVDAGKSDVLAGKAARDAFLNYDINAPWVRAARRSVLPFISFTYRAVPLLAKAVATKPWKIAKYAALGEALSMMAYMALGSGGDEEKEKRLLPEDMQGSSLGLPKMVRLPWNDKDGDPMWLDVRRWLPAGDLTETSNSKAAIPLPSWLSIGGPMSLLVDFYSNTDWRGEKIVKPTDSAGEVMLKVSDVLAKFALPNLPAPGLGWLLREMGAPVDTGQLDPYGWTGIERGLDGAKTGFGKEVDPTIQTARALGVKLDARRLRDEIARIGLDYRTKEKEIKTEAGAVGRKMQRGEISQEEGKRRIAREVEKLKELGKKTREKLAPAN